MDGVLAIKTEDDLEHKEVTDRFAFWVDDIVLCYWDDGEQYEAKSLASGCKFENDINFKTGHVL